MSDWFIAIAGLSFGYGVFYFIDTFRRSSKLTAVQGILAIVISILCIVGGLFLIVLLITTPARASTTDKMLAVSHVVDVLDGVTTIQCGRPNNGCVEKNAAWLYGREPSFERVIAVKVPTMILTHFIAKRLEREHPTYAKIFLGAKIIITGKFVGGNIALVW